MTVLATTGITQSLANKGSHAKASLQANVKDSSVNIFEHMSNQQSLDARIATLPAEIKAKYLANPASLGKEMFGYLEGFQQRSQSLIGRDYTKVSGAGNGQVLPGPAEHHPGVEANWDKAEGLLRNFRQMYTFLAETQLVTAGTTQGSRSVTTLLRSQ